MTQPIPLALRIGELLGAASATGLGHLAEAETDLAQTALLLAEAIEKLGASFMAIHASVSAQQEAVDHLLSGAVPSTADLENLKSIHREIGQHVNSAVTGLQFQDMTNQLLERSRSHVNGVRLLLCMLGETAARITPESTVVALESLLGETALALDEHKSLQRDTLRKAVNQTHMESGDVELF